MYIECQDITLNCIFASLGKKVCIVLIFIFTLFLSCLANRPVCSEARDILGIDHKWSPKPSKKSKLSWIFTLGWHAVDDNSHPFKKLLAIRSSWSLPFYPSQASAEIIGSYGVTYGFCFSFNRYKPGKEVNGQPMTSRALFFGFDAFAKYHVNEHVAMSRQYDPYFLVGAGYTLRFVAPNFSAFTVNVGPGINYWFNNHWGMNAQTLGQFGLKKKFPRNSSNYLHHSIGVVYIIDKTMGKKRSFIKPRYKWIHENRNLGERTR